MGLFNTTKHASASLLVDVATVGNMSAERSAAASLTIDAKFGSDVHDFVDLDQFLLTGHVNAIVVDGPDTLNNADLYNVWVPVTIVARPEVIFLKTTGIPRIVRLRPIPCRIDTGALKLIGGPVTEGVRLVANTDTITLPEGENLLYDVLFGKSTINGVEVDFSDMNFTFEAPYADTTVDLATVPRVYA